MNHGPKLVLVEFLDDVLRKTRGPVSVNGKLIYGDWFAEEVALKGERKGKWRIVKELEQGQPEVKVLKPAEAVEVQAPSPQSSTPQPNGVLRLKKKKVAWVQDQLHHGGAEESGRYVAKIGRDCGFDVTILTRDDRPERIREEMRASDVAVLNNLWAFSPGQMQAILKAIYSDLVPYIKYEHDHRELTRPDFSRSLFQRSRLNVFISPIHLENHAEALGCEGIVLPLAIDTERYRPVAGVQRIGRTALVSNVRNFKRWQTLQDYINAHPEIQFAVIGTDRVVSGPNVRLLAPVPPEEMPRLYSAHEFLVHLLDGWGAGERVVFEAALCGCKVVANEKVGHMSWGRPLEDANGLRDWLSQAPFEFWKEVEKLL